MASQPNKKTVADRARKASQAVATSHVGGALGRQIGGFMGFVREQGVVGLAVGLAIGTQAGATVKSIVEGFINPIVAFLVGSQQGLQSLKWTALTLNGRSLTFAWGQVVSSLITLLAVAAVIYYIVHGLKLDRVDKKK